MINLINSISRTVINRINYPKTLTTRTTREQSINARVRPLLSHHDEEDVQQTCALVLCQTGIPHATEQALALTVRIGTLCPLFAGSRNERASYSSAARTMGMTLWKAVFRAARRALRIDRRQEIALDFLDAPEIDISAQAHPEVTERRRRKLSRLVRYTHTLLHTSLGCDDSRKKKATFRMHLRTLRTFTCLWAGRFTECPLFEGTSQDALHAKLSRFRAYIERGEFELSRLAFPDGADRFKATANVPRPGELKTFSGL